MKVTPEGLAHLIDDSGQETGIAIDPATYGLPLILPRQESLEDSDGSESADVAPRPGTDIGGGALFVEGGTQHHTMAIRLAPLNPDYTEPVITITATATGARLGTVAMLALRNIQLAHVALIAIHNWVYLSWRIAESSAQWNPLPPRGITATAPDGSSATVADEGIALIVERQRELARVSQPSPKQARMGRPRGRLTIPALPTALNGVTIIPSGLPVQLYMDAIQAGSKADGWTANGEGHPEYRKDGKKMAGAVTYEALDTAIDAAMRDVWGDVAELGAADLQLFMCVSNALLLHPNPAEAILIDVGRYAEARGVSIKGTRAERNDFNSSVRRISSLAMRADVLKTTKGNKRETRSIRGRMVMPEVVATTSAGWITDPKTPISTEVTGWRLVPGTAWLACRELGHIGRYPKILMAMNPHKDDFLIRLGAFLGHQTAIRAAQGTIGQPLSVRAILTGMHEGVPDDRRRLQELRDRFAGGMDELRERGALLNWEWVGDEPSPKEFLGAMVAFIYQRECLDDYSKFYPATRRPMKSPEVQRLLPAGDGGRRNPTKTGQKPY